jgi:short-subunit dehydrogenase
MMRAVLPHLRSRQVGTVINVSSRAGLIGLPLISLYCASKYALEGFSESIAFELAAQHIRVKLIEPSGGFLQAKQTRADTDFIDFMRQRFLPRA